MIFRTPIEPKLRKVSAHFTSDFLQQAWRNDEGTRFYEVFFAAAFFLRLKKQPQRITLTHKKRILQVVIISVIVAILVAFFLELHFVDDWVGGVLVWNPKEAYLFSAWSGMGYRRTVVGFLATLVPAYFGASAPPNETRHSTIIFRITPAHIERYVAPDVAFRAYIPKDNTIYAWDGGPLWKWAGDHFERATPAEEREIIESQKLTMLSVAKDINDPNGWSVRSSLTGLPPKSEIDVSGKWTFLYVTLSDSDQEISVDVQIPGREREQILHAKSKLHVVTKREYLRAFRDGNPSSTINEDR